MVAFTSRLRHFPQTYTITEILEVERGASKGEIKKAFHKAALSSHPDKVGEDDRAAAEIQFKSVSQAYEILYDDEKRHLYDTHGMSAFQPGRGNGMGPGMDMDDILQQMFGMSDMGGGAAPRKSRKSDSEEQPYQVTLEELFKGKTTKFASKKNVICSHCKGSGGKDKAKPKKCESCQGAGMKQALRAVGPGLVTRETIECGSCKGSGNVFKEKDRCKKCKGNRVTEARKVLEIYIPRGSKEGDRIVLEGEADQVPDQQPGDIIFILVEVEHSVFRRSGADLLAKMEITLAESLCGFSRVVIKHLDGRGILINHNQSKGRILRPGQTLKVAGEGMPHKKSDLMGNLYLEVQIKFPEDGWLQDNAIASKLRDLLPKPAESITADIVDEVEYDETSNLEDYGAADDAQGDEWEDDGVEADSGGCAQQ